MSVAAIDAGLVKELTDARSILVITGAGMSADSGLPTYRGIGGLYEDEATEDGMPIEEALSYEMLRRDPAVTWRHIAHIEAACRGAGPNEGHRVLSRWASRFERCVILTQNVDGLHQAAGSTDVIAIHGDVHDLACMRCAYSITVPDYRDLTFPPPCPRCNSTLRPRVVLFGEMLPSSELNRLERELRRGFDVVMSIGTTSVFPYIAAPVQVAAINRRPTIEINPCETEVSSVVRWKLASKAASTLLALERALETA